MRKEQAADVARAALINAAAARVVITTIATVIMALVMTMTTITYAVAAADLDTLKTSATVLERTGLRDMKSNLTCKTRSVVTL